MVKGKEDDDDDDTVSEDQCNTVNYDNMMFDDADLVESPTKRKSCVDSQHAGGPGRTLEPGVSPQSKVDEVDVDVEDDGKEFIPGEVKTHIGKNVFAQAKKAYSTVDLRHFFFTNENIKSLHPTRRGINLNLFEFERLAKYLPLLEEKWAGLKGLTECASTHKSLSAMTSCKHCTPRPEHNVDRRLAKKRPMPKNDDDDDTDDVSLLNSTPSTSTSTSTSKEPRRDSRAGGSSESGGRVVGGGKKRRKAGSPEKMDMWWD